MAYEGMTKPNKVKGYLETCLDIPARLSSTLDMYAPRSDRDGVIAMESATVVKSSLFRCGGSSLSFSAMLWIWDNDPEKNYG